MDVRRPVLVLVWLIVLGMLVSGCGLEPADTSSPTELPAQASVLQQPTQAPTRQPTAEPTALRTSGGNG